MKSNFFSRRSFLVPLAFASLASHSQAASILLTSPIKETFGTIKTIPGGGSASNTDSNWVYTANPGASTRLVSEVAGAFNITVDGVAQYMTVEVTGSSTGVTPAQDSLMVVQTVNSQGLTDTATLSIYVRPTPVAAWIMDITLRFWDDYSAGTQEFSNPLATNVAILTSLDIDFSQRFYFKTSDVASTWTSPTTQITPVAPGNVIPGYTGFRAAGDATFNNPDYAVGARSVPDDSFSFKLAHNNVALYMIELRDPSNYLVPEPSSALLGALGLLGLLSRRRR